MPSKRAQAAKPAESKESESVFHQYRFVGPIAQVFPDLGVELGPGDEFQSELEIHHFHVETKDDGGWVSTYQASPEILQGPNEEAE